MGTAGSVRLNNGQKRKQSFAVQPVLTQGSQAERSVVLDCAEGQRC